MATRPPIHLAVDRDPWHRQPTESQKMYSRFFTFMELGRARTLNQTKEMLDTLGDKLTYNSLYQVSYTFRWTERSEAFDRDQDRQEAQRLLLLRREMLARHRRLAAGLHTKAVKALTDLKPEELTALDIVRFIKYGAELERKALGEPDTHVALSGPGGGPIGVEDFSQYEPDERRARLRSIAQELNRRAGLHDDDDDE